MAVTVATALMSICTLTIMVTSAGASLINFKNALFCEGWSPLGTSYAPATDSPYNFYCTPSMDNRSVIMRVMAKEAGHAYKYLMMAAVDSNGEPLIDGKYKMDFRLQSTTCNDQSVRVIKTDENEALDVIATYHLPDDKKQSALAVVNCRFFVAASLTEYHRDVTVSHSSSGGVVINQDQQQQNDSTAEMESKQDVSGSEVPATVSGSEVPATVSGSEVTATVSGSEVPTAASAADETQPQTESAPAQPEETTPAVGDSATGVNGTAHNLIGQEGTTAALEGETEEAPATTSTSTGSAAEQQVEEESPGAEPATNQTEQSLVLQEKISSHVKGEVSIDVTGGGAGGGAAVTDEVERNGAEVIGNAVNFTSNASDEELQNKARGQELDIEYITGEFGIRKEVLREKDRKLSYKGQATGYWCEAYGNTYVLAPGSDCKVFYQAVTNENTVEVKPLASVECAPGTRFNTNPGKCTCVSYRTVVCPDVQVKSTTTMPQTPTVLSSADDIVSAVQDQGLNSNQTTTV